MISVICFLSVYIPASIYPPRVKAMGKSGTFTCGFLSCNYHQLGFLHQAGYGFLGIWKVIVKKTMENRVLA